jgi:phosphohistidine phosphatase SixA
MNGKTVCDDSGGATEVARNAGDLQRNLEAPFPLKAAELFMSTSISSPAIRPLVPRTLPLLLLLAAAAVHGDESLSKADLVAALQRGGYVILMRHASSPGTTPDAAHANADNPRLERQLDEQGQASARTMGEAFRRLRIPIGKVLSSPTYRALETVKLAKLGQPTTFSELGQSEQGMSADNSGSRAAWLKAKAAERLAAGTNTLIVTHYPNIAEAFPQEADGLAEGEALILRPDKGDGASLMARVKIDEWASLAAARR